MAFEEWLALGGNEILNNARTVGYARTAKCPMSWFKGQVCPTLAAATLTVAQYHTAAIEAAPWYDPALPEISRRFYGAYGLAIKGIEDSTREATVTQGLGDGGVIGRVRKGPREVRVVALLAGEGRDALEYGMAWLNAALDPNACGQHGDACGTADLAYFSDCPPARRDIPLYSDPELAATNLNLNPSMETPGPVAELRRNLWPNPRVSDNNSGWAVGGSSNGVTLTATPDGMQADFATAQNNIFVIDGTWINHAAQTTHAFAADIAVPVGYPAVRLRVMAQFGDGGVPSVYGPEVTIQPGEAAELTALVPANAATSTRPIIQAVAVPAGARFVLNRVLFERTDRHLPYFDGSTVDSTNSPFTYAWSGAPDASESAQSAPTVLHYSQSELRFAYQTRSPDGQPYRGDYAIRAVAGTSGGDIRVNDLAFTAGQTYTVEADVYLPKAHITDDPSAASRQRRILVYENGGATTNHGPQAPNVAGWHHLSHTFVATADMILGLGSAGSAQDNYFETIWDSVSVVEGTPYLGGYFDGDTEDTGTEIYEWLGTPHDSASTATTQLLLGNVPESPESYLHEVNKVRRYLHDVAAVSGPLVQAEFQSGVHWGYRVEFTLVAANPYVFGVTQRLDLPPRLPTVVGDVPYNLVPYPSAELSSGPITVARNLALNPSAEYGANHWFASGVYTLSGQSNELASHGAYSFKVRFLPDAVLAAPYEFFATQTVPLPHAAVPGERYSINEWASASVETGNPVLGQLQIQALWLDAARTVLRMDVIGDLPPGGGAASMRSIEPPPGATQVEVRAAQTVTSWDAGAVVRLYADALAVTVP